MNEKALADAVARLHGQFTGDRNTEIKSSLPTAHITHTTDVPVSVNVPDFIADYPLRKEQETAPESTALYDHIREFVRASGIKSPIVITPLAPGAIKDPTRKELTAESTVECPVTHFPDVSWTDLANTKPEVFPPSEPGIITHREATIADIVLNYSAEKPAAGHYTVVTLKDRKSHVTGHELTSSRPDIDLLYPMFAVPANAATMTNPHDVSELDRQLAAAEVKRNVGMVAGDVNDSVRITFPHDRPLTSAEISITPITDTHRELTALGIDVELLHTKHSQPTSSLKDKVDSKDPLYMDVRLRSRYERQPLLQVITHAMEYIPLKEYLLRVADYPLLCDYMRVVTHNLWLDEHQSMRVAVPDGVSCEFNKRPRFLIGQSLDPQYSIGMTSDTARLLNVLVTTRLMPTIMGVPLNHPIRLPRLITDAVDRYMHTLARICLTELRYVGTPKNIVQILDKLTGGVFSVRLPDIYAPPIGRSIVQFWFFNKLRLSMLQQIDAVRIDASVVEACFYSVKSTS